MKSWKEKTVVVTGATEGIGLVTAKEIAATGARTVLIGRNPEKTQARLLEVREYAKSKGQSGDAVEFALADFSKQKSIRALGKELRERLSSIDVLVNNAGAVYETRVETEDGLELTFALNHIGYFLLTQELLPLVEKAGTKDAPARIVSVSSDAHRGGSMHFNDLQLKQGFSGMKAYTQSKLANILFTKELARRVGEKNVTANCLHPGVIASGFGKNSDGWIGALSRTFSFFLSTPEKGARTQIYLATSPDVAHVTGEYFSKCKVARPTAEARNEAAAKRLWTLSEEIVAKSA
jgi:NAD(P)-dependent dehydrogenase (short-subunit alcohol dehydrogenase family)